ncbi:hypothetical protein R1sor_024127 [Riccia sorocarpa]|uniref:Aminotransferase-like plant mobile domain-containing protein n=1 Tax=Riccia sorocarpa TaxID=122646 RepID=A0ABD3GR53_9MARC
MASSAATETLGLRQRTINIMDSSFLSKFSSPVHRALMSTTAFVPYSFKEFKDLDIVEFSALRQLLVTGIDGRSNVIGWDEIMTAFGGEHSDEDEFRGNKIMHRQLAPYKPSEFLPEIVEKNLNKELVSGKDYEEVLYYREAAPYGPTYYIMTLIAEVFWSASRSNGFLMPMVYSYLRVLHGHPYNWAKAILKSLKSEIAYLQKEARAVKDQRRPTTVVWAPVFIHLLYTFLHRIFAGSALAEAELWVHWKLMSKDGDLPLAGLVDKFPKPIFDLTILRERCKLSDPDDLPEADLAAPVNGATVNGGGKKKTPKKPKASRAIVIQSEGSEEEAPPKPKRRKPDTPGPRVRFTEPPRLKMTPANREHPEIIRTVEDLAIVLSEDIKVVLEKRYASLVSQLGPKSADLKMQLEALEKSKAEADANHLAAIQSHIQQAQRLTTQLETAGSDNEVLCAKVANMQRHICALNDTCNETKKSLADQTASLQDATRTRSEAALSASERYKQTLDSDLESASRVQLEKERLEDEISTLKFNLERAEKTQTSARQELAQARIQLRRIQVHGEPGSSREKSA